MPGDLSNKIGAIGEKAVEAWLQARNYPFMRTTELCLRSWPKDHIGYMTTPPPQSTEGFSVPRSQVRKLIAARGYLVYETREVEVSGKPMTVVIREPTEKERARFRDAVEERVRRTELLVYPEERGGVDALFQEAERQWVEQGGKLGWEGSTFTPCPYYPDYTTRIPGLGFLEVKANTSRLVKGQAEFLNLARRHGFVTRLARVVVPSSIIVQAEEFLGQGLLALRWEGNRAMPAVKTPLAERFLEERLRVGDAGISVSIVELSD